jgi:hypothetical protein
MEVSRWVAGGRLTEVADYCLTNVLATYCVFSSGPLSRPDWAWPKHHSRRARRTDRRGPGRSDASSFGERRHGVPVQECRGRMRDSAATGAIPIRDHCRSGHRPMDRGAQKGLLIDLAPGLADPDRQTAAQPISMARHGVNAS